MKYVEWLGKTTNDKIASITNDKKEIVTVEKKVKGRKVGKLKKFSRSVSAKSRDSYSPIEI